MSWQRKTFDKNKHNKKKYKRTTGRRWMSMRHVVLVEEPVCMICGRRSSTEVDHIIPVCKGGTDIRDNLQGVCDECHAEKTAKDLGIKPPPNKVGIDGYPIPKEENDGKLQHGACN